MGYQVLARKYRPQRFADVAGQDHVTRTLLNALAQNRIAHGYIFSGHRGIGKTTIARILAMALNCRTQVGSSERPTHEPCLQCVSCREISSGGNPAAGELATHSFDFIEIDAASNRGIDDVRSIRTQALVQPARDRYKIFLLDEAHQITDAAFNAILKTLEEPPEWTIFMMATTEPENIPQTIRSRCQHFSFHAVKFDDIVGQLKMIAERERVAAEEAALALLAEAGDGSMRDALSIMDQAIASAPTQDGHPVLAVDQIRALVGSVPNAVFERLLEAVAACQSAELMEQLHVLLNAGHSPLSLARQMVRYLRNALMAKLGGEQTELLQISADERARATRTALLFTEEDLTRNLQIVLRTFDDLNYRQEQRLHLELGLLKLIQVQRLLPLEELLSGVAGSAGIRRATTVPAPRSAPPAAPKSFSASIAPAAASPVSPFATSAVRPNLAAEQPEVKSTLARDAAIEAPIEMSSTQREATPFLVQSSSVPAAGFAEVLTEGSLAKAPESLASPSDPTAEQARAVICAALSAAGHISASQLLGSGVWTIENASLRVEVASMGKKMLSLTVNAAAEKIVRGELQKLGASTRFLVVPGTATGGGPAPTLAPVSGSVEAEALKHPLVQRATQIFNAEVRSVIDLRVQ